MAARAISTGNRKEKEMKKRYIVIAAAVLSLGIAVCGCSLESSDENVTLISMSDLEALNGGKMPEIQYYYDSDRISLVYGKVSDTKVNNKDDALYVFKELSGLLNISDAESDLRFSVRNPNKGGGIYVFDQYYKDVPTNGSIALSVDSVGNTTRLLNRYIPDIDISVEPELSAEDAAKKAENRYSAKSCEDPKLLVYYIDKKVKLVWDVKLRRSDYPDEVFVDAFNGDIVAEDGPISEVKE